jgi:hypothetical protein
MNAPAFPAARVRFHPGEGAKMPAFRAGAAGVFREIP